MKLTLARRCIDAYPDSALFEEFERIWNLLGHRPSKIEWEASQPKISYNTLRRRFGGWVNAGAAFIEHKMGFQVDSPTPSIASPIIKQEEKRTIPLQLRLKVLERDSFACVYCGRTPALTKGVILHIDHKVPFSEKGKSTLENLQTLCSECNLGKGKQIIKAEQGAGANG